MNNVLGALLLVAGMSAGGSAVAQAGAALSVPERAMVQAVDASAAGDVALLERLVNINSGTMNAAGVVAVKDVLAPQFEALGFKVRWVPMQALDGRAGDLVAEHLCGAGAGLCGKRILLIGHMDTVFEPGSTFQKYSLVPGTEGKVATGPGVSDMKGGLVIMLSALRAMKAAGVLEKSEIRIVLSGDEERHGEPVSVSRADMLEAARHSDVALEFEDEGRENGKDTVRIARRSSLSWKLETTGRTGHSSGIFSEEMGFGAAYEMARILDRFRTELREDGLTYNVGLMLGGATVGLNANDTGGTAAGKANVIPPAALAEGDIRTLTNEQTARVEAKMQAIVADHLAKTGATIAFGEGYPAMAETEGSRQLLKQLNEVNAALGFEAEGTVDPRKAGAGDISFVAPIVPVGLVGVGSMGAGAHAEGETVFLDSLPTQAKRMAILMARLGR